MIPRRTVSRATNVGLRRRIAARDRVTPRRIAARTTRARHAAAPRHRSDDDKRATPLTAILPPRPSVAVPSGRSRPPDPSKRATSGYVPIGASAGSSRADRRTRPWCGAISAGTWVSPPGVPMTSSAASVPAPGPEVIGSRNASVGPSASSRIGRPASAAPRLVVVQPTSRTRPSASRLGTTTLAGMPTRAGSGSTSSERRDAGPATDAAHGLRQPDLPRAGGDPAVHEGDRARIEPSPPRACAGRTRELRPGRRGPVRDGGSSVQAAATRAPLRVARRYISELGLSDLASHVDRLGDRVRHAVDRASPGRRT